MSIRHQNSISRLIYNPTFSRPKKKEIYRWKIKHQTNRAGTIHLTDDTRHPHRFLDNYHKEITDCSCRVWASCRWDLDHEDKEKGSTVEAAQAEDIPVPAPAAWECH